MNLGVNGRCQKLTLGGTKSEVVLLSSHGMDVMSKNDSLVLIIAAIECKLPEGDGVGNGKFAFTSGLLLSGTGRNREV